LTIDHLLYFIPFPSLAWIGTMIDDIRGDPSRNKPPSHHGVNGATAL
jgi:hypothetical protein